MDSRNRVRKIDIILVGVYGIVTQTVLLREMLALFRGTEFVIGVIIACWMLWVGAGSIWGGRIFGDLFANRFRNFQMLIIAAAILLPSSAVLIRFGRTVLSSVPGEYPPFGRSLVFCIFSMAPAGFAGGLLYNEGSRWWKMRSGSIARGVSAVYILEAAGSLAGGVVFSLILLRFFDQLEITLIIFAVITLVAARPFRTGRSAAALLLLMIPLCIYSVMQLERISSRLLFPGYRIIDKGSSKYGEIAVVEREGGISAYSSGSRLFSVPGISRAEEIIHIPLLCHPEPESVLIVGGGIRQDLAELRKHRSVSRAEFVQLDGKLVGMMRDQFISGGATGIQAELIIGDGRRYIRTSQNSYDVIMVNAPDPVNIEINRYYTVEFFRWAKKRLREGGILAVNHSTSENFISEYQARVLKSLKGTLNEIFDKVTLLPGPEIYFICGKKSISYSDISDNLREREIESVYINEDYLPSRFNSGRSEFLRSEVEAAEWTGLNTDLNPSLVAHELFLELHRSGYRPPDFVIRFFSGGMTLICILAGVLVIILFSFSGSGLAARLDIWTVGMTGFLLQISILLTYQSFTGYLYEGIIILTAGYMAGISGGTLLSMATGAGLLKRGRLIHAALVMLAILHYYWAAYVSGSGAGLSAGTAGFILFSIIGGFLTGIFYRAVVSNQLSDAAGQQPAVFYGWDMFGAGIGAILGGIFLFPAYGIMGVLAVIIFLHLAGMILLTGRWQGRR